MIRPQPGPQERFLATSADIAIYGGAAGGGKTWALLVEAARHKDRKGYSAAIFRRTTQQIRKPGSLWDESQRLYHDLGATPRESFLDWKFRSGATVKFAGIQYDKDREDWKGAQLGFVGFDELTDFSESTFWFLLGRARTTCGINPVVRATCNPDPNSWVLGFIGWWIGEDGYAIKERGGIVRYFVRRGDEVVWGDSKKELLDKFLDLSEIDVKSATFIPATVHDNPELLQKNPEYLANLRALPLVDCMRFLEANWKVVASGNFFRTDWFQDRVLDLAPNDWLEGKLVRSWDLATTKPKPGNQDPDWCVGLLIGETKTGRIVVVDVIRTRGTPGEIVATIKVAAESDRATFGYVRTHLEQEGGSHTAIAIDAIVKELSGFWVTWETAKTGKEFRAKPVSSRAQAGHLWLVRGPWLSQFLSELTVFPKKGVHDDQVDALSAGFHCLHGATVDAPTVIRRR